MASNRKRSCISIPGAFLNYEFVCAIMMMIIVILVLDKWGPKKKKPELNIRVKKEKNLADSIKYIEQDYGKDNW